MRSPGANPSAYNVSFATPDAQKFEALADAYIALNGTKSPANYKDYLQTDDPNLKVIFLNRLVARQDDFEINLIQKIDADYNCTWEKNPEIGQRWLPLAIAFAYEPVYDASHYYVSW